MNQTIIDEFFSNILGRSEHMLCETDVIIRNGSRSVLNIFPQSFFNLLKTPSVIRMARILQNGTKVYVYKTPIHTRLEHSKGTYTRTLELLINLYVNDPLVRSLTKDEHYKKYFIALLIRAILHDIGHGPFSHTMELVCGLKKGFHEEVGSLILEKNSDLRECLDRIYPGLPSLIKEVKDMDFLGLNRLFEGQFDVDRADFLGRDCCYFADYETSRRVGEITDELLKSIRLRKIPAESGERLVPAESGERLVPVFPESQLANISEFLGVRYTNYRDIYHNPKAEAYDILLREFAQELIKSDEESPLKNFLKGNIGKRPDEIDLDEYIKFNDVEFFKGIFEVAKKTKNEKLKRLVSLLIPLDKDLIEGLYYGLLVSFEQMDDDRLRPHVDPVDGSFIKDLGSIINDPESELVSLANEYKYGENVLVLDRNDPETVNACKQEILTLFQKSENELSSIGITFTKSKVTFYKNKPGEEIYIEGSNGEIHEYSSLLGKSNTNLSSEVISLVVLVPKLRENGIPEETIEKLKGIIDKYSIRIDFIIEPV